MKPGSSVLFPRGSKLVAAFTSCSPFPLQVACGNCSAGIQADQRQALGYASLPPGKGS